MAYHSIFSFNLSLLTTRNDNFLLSNHHHHITASGHFIVAYNAAAKIKMCCTRGERNWFRNSSCFILHKLYPPSTLLWLCYPCMTRHILNFLHESDRSIAWSLWLRLSVFNFFWIFSFPFSSYQAWWNLLRNSNSVIGTFRRETEKASQRITVIRRRLSGWFHFKWPAFKLVWGSCSSLFHSKIMISTMCMCI